MAGTRLRSALVIGGATCVFDDIERALSLGEFDCVMACNDVMAQWRGHLDAAATLHAEKLAMWLGQRRSNGYAPPARAFVKDNWRDGMVSGDIATVERLGAVDTPQFFQGHENTGSSGLFATKVALVDMGVDRAVLAGIPISPEMMNVMRGRRWHAALSYRRGWEQALPVIERRVRSMSGWTMELLGYPTERWMAGH